MKSLDKCLSSSGIQRLIDNRHILGDISEGSIQPSSLEPTLGEEIFILDAQQGLFRPKRNESVYKTLSRIPKGRRPKRSIAEGFEIKKGHTYLIPLREKIQKNSDFEFILSSPKSSIGRLFPQTRLLCDHNDCFDEIQNFPKGKYLDQWLLIQPLAFNKIIHPGISLNQTRFFQNGNARLTPNQIMQEWKINPLLYENKGGELAPITSPSITNELQLHLNLEGKTTGGIVGFRARKNPEPIDLNEKAAYVAEEFFEPIKAKGGRITLEPGEHYLLSTKEVLGIPAHLNAELQTYSHLGLSGPLHRAGFIDNGFCGDLVLEVTSNEQTNIDLEDGIPIGELKIYRTEKTEKIYGEKIGSNYQGQQGPKVSKHFKPFDFDFAARNYAKLDKHVLVQSKEIALQGREPKIGFNYVDEKRLKEVISNFEDRGFFHSRYDCEGDDMVLQAIPYALIFNKKGEVFSYVRANNIKDYGDKRLFGKHSIGLGGHIKVSDGPAELVRNALEREVMEEEVHFSKPPLKKVPIGTIFQPDKPVDRDHFGIVYAIYTDGDVFPDESSIVSGGMFSLTKIINDKDANKKYETWSRVLVPHLNEIYNKIK